MKLLLLTMLLITTGIFNRSRSVDIARSHTMPRACTQDTVPYATLYFYRSYIEPIIAPLKKVPIYVNDSLVYKLKANTVVSLKVYKEGHYTIASDKKGENENEIKVAFGKQYFFKCEIQLGLWFGKPSIELVTTQKWISESEKLKAEEL